MVVANINFDYSFRNTIPYYQKLPNFFIKEIKNRITFRLSDAEGPTSDAATSMCRGREKVKTTSDIDKKYFLAISISSGQATKSKHRG